MGTRDPRVDAYIAKQADFAKPILAHLRDVVHAACPEVEEDIKWGAPFFMYRGTLCQMAAFKAHCAFGFWKGALVVGRSSGDDDRAAGQFGRITSVKDLPSKKELTAYIKKAMRINEEGVRVPKAKRARPAPGVPGARGGAGEEPQGARGVRGVLPEPQARLLRMDRRGQARRDEGRARRTGGGVDGGGEASALEVPAAVSW
jgi:hypothetical protein